MVPNVEEFGIAAVEAQAAGRPVLAPDAGGTRETVIDGRPASSSTPERRAAGRGDALCRLRRLRAAAAAVQNAQRFSKREFQRRLRLELESRARAA